MKVKELRELLARFPDDREVLARCTWEGEEPAGEVFEPRTVALDIDHDTAEEFIAIECDQEWE